MKDVSDKAISIRLLYAVTTVLVGPLSHVSAEEIYPGYEWQALGEDIFLHTRTDPLAGPVDGNSVVIINPDSVVIVDTHINPAAARAVIAKIQALTKTSVKYVINTHWHDDHANGNQAFREAFPDVKIIAHRATLAAMKQEWQKMEDDRASAYAGIDTDELRQVASEREDELERIGYRVYAGYVDALRPELAAMVLAYPDTVFEQSYVIDSGSRRVEVHWLGKGNTEGDLVVWIPENRFLITGDLVVAPIPFAFDSPLEEWITTLRKIGQFSPATTIPGHGPAFSGTDYVSQVESLLVGTLEKVRSSYETGVAFTELINEVDLSRDEDRFTDGSAEHAFAWRTYYLQPALESAWTSLGYPLKAE